MGNISDKAMLDSDASCTENALKVISQFEKSGATPAQTAASLAIALNAMCKDKQVAFDLIEELRPE